ncbi:MAG: hypothetical protein HC887_10320 [Desulfobacteraceae bacterium]|nr:hypothetical protein [Desulfobacteraceae bacterium]
MNQSLKIVVWVIAAMMGMMINIAAAEDVRETVMDEIVITGTKSEKRSRIAGQHQCGQVRRNRRNGCSDARRNFAVFARHVSLETNQHQ